MKVSKILFLTALTAMTAMCSTARADTANKSFIFALQEGPAWLSGGGGSHIQWGGEVLYNLIGPLEVGAYINYLGRGTLTDPDTNTKLSANYLTYGGQAMYDSSSIVSGTSFGARMGLLHNSLTRTDGITGNEEDHNSTNFSIGPIVEYEVPINTNFTVGGVFNILFNTGDLSHNDIALMATLKYYL